MGKNIIECPVCFHKIEASKKIKIYECPICKASIDLNEQVQKQDLKSTIVIKYEGTNDVFVWKHPIEDFSSETELIVHDTQEAILFNEGKALDLYGAGRYTLNKGLDIKHCEVYFINMTTQIGIKWGTDSKVRLFDPFSGMHLEIGACGSFNIRVENSRKLLLKLVGTTNKLEQDELFGDVFSTQKMLGKLKGLIISNIKTYLGKTIKEKNINILEVDEHINEISLVLKDEINEMLDEYGLIMPEFFITTIITPDDDPNYKKMKEQYAEHYLKVKQEHILKDEALAAKERKIIEAKTEAEVYVIKAEAEAKGEKVKSDINQKVDNTNGWICDNCGANVTTPFCPVCGTKNLNAEGWDCKCGTKSIMTAYCHNCGMRKED